MSLLYFIAMFLSVVVPLVFLILKRPVFPAAIVVLVTNFSLAGVFHYAARRSVLGDYETWSGQIGKAVHYPRWVEREERDVADYDSKGKKKGSHTEVSYETHPQRWQAETTTGETHDIESLEFHHISRKFNDLTTETPNKSGFYSGDPNIYVSYNKTDYCFPTTTTRYFDNRLKAQPTLFGFAEVPKTVKVFPYPENKDWQRSSRLLGPVQGVDLLAFDQMNARLGPIKKVNFILVAFGEDAQMGQYQQASWAGGRKNDLVLCYDAVNPKPNWAFCFGWTEQEIVKRNIESIVLDQGVSTATLPAIEKQIATNYIKRAWHKSFGYISVPVPNWAIIWFSVVLMIVQGAFCLFWKFEDSKPWNTADIAGF